MTLEKISGLLGPNNAMVFAQPPGVGFFPMLLSQIAIPSPTRAALSLTQTEDVTRSWAMVRNPLERVTAQSRIRQPTSLTITGMLSADPVFSPLALLGVARLDRAELAKLIGIIGLSVCFVVTPSRAYPNMGCVVLSEKYDDDTGRGVRLTLKFEEFAMATPAGLMPELDIVVAGIGALSSSDMGSTTAAAVPTSGITFP